MSIYHLNMSNVSRAAGSSSCATLSYISGVAIHEDRTNQNYSYGRAERVVLTGTIIPPGAPAEFRNPEVLFNSIEDYEKAANARPAKKIEIALPREFDLQTSRDVVEDYIKRKLTVRGYAATYAIHHDADGKNPHVHILVANRQINPKTGEWGGKRKMIYETDANGERVPLLDKKTGQQKVDSHGRKQWKRINAEVNPLDEKSMLRDLRAAWAEVCNERLQPADHIDARSYAEQGIEKIPTVHEGYAARAIAEAGGISDRIELNKQIRQANAELMRIAAERQTCYANLVILEREQEQQQAEAERQRQEAAARAASKAAEERRQQEAGDVLKRIEQLFNPGGQPRQEESAIERERREAAERAAAEQRRQAARKRDNAETERTYEKYWSGRLKDLDWRQLEEFCKGEYQQRRRAAHDQAWEKWIKDHIDDVTDHFTKCRDEEKKKFAVWQRENPRPPEPEPQRGNAFTRWIGLHQYKNSDWQEGDHIYTDADYQGYYRRQKGIIQQWENNVEYPAKKSLNRAEQELKYCKDRNITKIIETLEDDYRDGHMFYYSKPRHGKLYDMIAAGARKLFETLKDFAPVRAMITVVNSLAHDRGEERRKDLAAEREQQREQQHQRSQGRGGYYR